MPIRHGRLTTTGPVRTVLRFVGTAVVVVLVSVSGVAAFAVVHTIQAIKPGIHLASLPLPTTAAGSTPTPTPTPTSLDGAINVLLTGTDTRTGQGGEFGTPDQLAGSSGVGSNDVTMVLHVAADHESATVVSIPRDLIVPIPECQNGSSSSPASSGDMFNTTLSRGGLSCVVITAEKLTGLYIPYAAEISFDGVIALSNAVGGVPVCLATPIVDPYVGLNLKAGQQTLVGSTALAFLRSRHGVGDGSDLGRIGDQQLFLSSLLRTITSAGVLSNPLTLYALAQAAVSNMQLSDTLTQPATLVSIALALKNISLSKIVFLQFPAVADPADSARVIPDDSVAATLTAALAADQPLQLAGTLGSATVLAAPGAASAAATPTPAPSSSSNSTTGAAPTSSPTAVVLPPSVTGQTADEQTCAKGN